MGLQFFLLRFPGRCQRLENSLERRCAGHFLLRQVVDGLIHQAHVALEARRVFVGESQAALGQFVQQAASGVVSIAEKTRVVAHQLANGGLQVLDSPLHGRQQARILKMFSTMRATTSAAMAGDSAALP